MKMQYRRLESGCLKLFVYEDNTWKSYKQSKNYIVDYQLSTDSGFRTFQNCLTKGYKVLPTINEED